MIIEDLSRVTIILRGYTYSQVRAVAKAMEGTEFNTMEITTNSPDAFETVEKISNEFKDLFVGVGTVTNMEQAKSAVEANAKFILSPISLSKDIIDYCKSNKLLVVAAGFTPNDVYKMKEGESDVIKIFPASELSYKYPKALRGPLGDLKLMAVGGVNINNANKFLKGGYDYLGIGSGMFNPDDIQNEDIKSLKKSLEKMSKELGEKNE